jgi:serine-type D-Ala-D-Ala carboxypeptidase (penicillin-binding protein 5/6)
MGGVGRLRRGSARLALLCLPAALAALWLAASAPLAAAAGPPPSVHAPSAIIIDGVTGRVLCGVDIHHERPMASTTKIMTALLVVQRAPDLGKTIVAPAAVAFTSGIGLRPGERITIRQALFGLMIKSAQDCALTLATAMAGSEPAFVRWMNAKARALGLRDTHYDNAAGGHRDPNHHSSVYDLARLGRYAMRDSRFADIAGRERAVVRWGGGRQLSVRSNNRLLRFDWADGVKCGFTPVAGYCLVGSGQPGLRPFVTATLKAPDRELDAHDHVALFEWASTLYHEVEVASAGVEVTKVPLAGGGEVHVAAQSTLTAVVRDGAPLGVAFTLPAVFSEPPQDGTAVGSVVYRADGVRLGSVKLVVVTPPPPPEPVAGAETPAPAEAD